MNVQLDFFQPNDPASLEKRELTEMRDLVIRSNRAQFAKMGDLGKEILKLHEDLDRLRDLLIKD